MVFGVGIFCAISIVYFLKNEIDKLDNRITKLDNRLKKIEEENGNE